MGGHVEGTPLPGETTRERGVTSPPSATTPRRVGGLGVRAQAHSRLLQSSSANHLVDASQLRALRWSPASVRRRTDTRTAGPAQMQACFAALPGCSLRTRTALRAVARLAQ